MDWSNIYHWGIWLIDTLSDDHGNGRQNLILIVTALTAFISYRGIANQNRRTRSLEFNEKLISDQQLTKAFQLITKLPQDPGRRVADLKAAMEEEERRTLIVYFLNTYEALAIGVQKGVYDEALLEKAQRRLVIRSYDAVEPCIHDRRLNAPMAYVEFESLVKHWKRQCIKDERRAYQKKVMKQAFVILLIITWVTAPTILADITH